MEVQNPSTLALTDEVEPMEVAQTSVEQIALELVAAVETVSAADPAAAAEQSIPESPEVLELVVPVDQALAEPTEVLEPSSTIQRIALDGTTINSMLLLEETVASSRAAAEPMQENAPVAEEIAALETDQLQQSEAASEIVLPSATAPAPLTVKDEYLQRHLDFLAFYGLIESPFEVTPDPAYLYLSQFHQDALFTILQGVQNFRGFMALVAEPGLGKTTLLNKLNEELKDSARTVFVFQTQCNSKEFLGYLLSELGIDSTGMDIVAMHRALNAVLLEEMFQGRRFVLIVDEAQNLDAASLETIRLLSNFETTHSKLIQIILAGQPQLLDTLKKPELAQLRQRIASLATLQHLDAGETASYVEHRLHTAGSRNESIFTPDALELIAQRSKGIPREINNICFNALISGYAKGSRTIDTEIVQQSLAKMNFDSLLDTPQESPTATPEPDTTMTLLGKVTEKLRNRTWETNKETRILVSLEREATPGIPVADRYYCCSFYVNEELAKNIEPNQQVKIKIVPR